MTLVSENSYKRPDWAPLFEGLSCEIAASVAGSASVRQVGAGTTLFHQGDPSDYLMLMADGVARLTQLSPGGAQTTLGIAGPRAVIGCVAAFQQFPYPATATAIAKSTVLSWETLQFYDLMRQYSVLAENMLHIVSAHAHELGARVVELSSKRAEPRIADALMRLASQAGTEVETGIQLAFPVTRRDLAGMAGVTHFTISRILNQWQSVGLITSGRRRLTILAPAQLVRLAAGGGA
jgi:CRP-like cAMP-binding protein